MSRRAHPFWFSLLAAVALLSAAARAATTAPAADIEIFVREGCPHCAAAEAFLDDLARERPGLRVATSDIRRDPAALARVQELWRRAGIAQPGVPTMLVGNEMMVGFGTPETTGAWIRAALDRQAAARAGKASTCPTEHDSCTASGPEDSVALPFVGTRVSVDDIGLPLFTVAVGLLDGFNPCSMWALILMLSMLAALGDRRRMLAVAGTFVAVQGIAYFAFMAAWLNLFLLIGLSRPSEIAIALLALAAGAINLKDFFAFRRGITLSIPASARSGFYNRLRAVLRAERLAPALLGVVVLAVMMQLVELLCTSGFPALYTRILTLRQLDTAGYYGYLLLYNAMYMLDDAIILGIGVVTLSQRRLQEREGRYLKLAAGLAMLFLGAYLLLPH